MPSIDTAQVALAYRASHLQKGNLIVWSIFAFIFLCLSIVITLRVFRRRLTSTAPRLPYAVLLVAVLFEFAACVAAIAANVIDGTEDWFVAPKSFIAASTSFDLTQDYARTALFAAVCMVFIALHEPFGRPGRFGMGAVHTAAKCLFAFYVFAMFALATATAAVSGDVQRKLRDFLIGDSDSDLLPPGSGYDIASIVNENKAANDMSLYAFPALFIGTSFFVVGYAVSFVETLRTSAGRLVGRPRWESLAKTLVTVTTAIYVLFVIAVLNFIFLFRFVKPSQIDGGELSRKLGLASSIIYNVFFMTIAIMLVLLSGRWPSYVWSPKTGSEPAMKTVTPGPVPPPKTTEAAAAAEPREETHVQRREAAKAEEDLIQV